MAKPYKQEKKAYKKAKRKHVSLWKTVALFCAILTVIMLPVNIVLGMFDNTVSLLVAGNSFWELENKDYTPTVLRLTLSQSKKRRITVQRFAVR